MKKIILPTLISLLAVTGLAFAETASHSTTTRITTTTTTESRSAGADFNADNKGGDSMSSTSQDNDESMDSENNDSEDHSMALSKVTAELDKLAEKDQDAQERDELKSVSQEQNDSKDRATEAMKNVENRNGFLTFLIGTDYKNLGALRSELKTTENNIARLEKAEARTTDPALKAGLQTQIDALKTANANAQNFITANESKFSVFGWFFKLFNQ